MIQFKIQLEIYTDFQFSFFEESLSHAMYFRAQYEHM
jgi:hypothetical protein